MNREEKPLTPEWLRLLRDAHVRQGPGQDAQRRKAALNLAQRLDLKVSDPAVSPVHGA